jgi:probable HAF family extracellular repeat protein
VLTTVAVLTFTGAAFGGWTFIDLGSLDGRGCLGVDVNNAGQVTGYSTYEGGGDFDYHPFIWENGSMIDLGTIGDAYLAQPTAISEAGQVAGWSKIQPYPDNHAFFWENGTMTDLGTLGGSQTWGEGVNSAGHVVGYQSTPGCAFLWDGTTMQDLNSSSNPDWQLTGALDINDSEQIVGQGNIDGSTRAFLYDAGVITNLGVLGTGDNSSANAISESGIIVGRSTNGETYRPGPGPMTRPVNHGFLWQDGVMTDLGTLGGILSEAFDVNASGQVVGKANYTEGDFHHHHAFLWDDGVMIDLNDLLPAGSEWELREATGINDLGYIVGWGMVNGVERGFILVPEPSTLTCLLGLGALLFARGRRNAS